MCSVPYFQRAQNFSNMEDRAYEYCKVARRFDAKIEG